MRKTVLIVPILFLLFFLNAEKTFACTCAMDTAPLDKQIKFALKNSTAVFTAEVVEITEPTNSYSVIIKLKVGKSWKGNNSPEVTLTTGRGGGDCGFRFELGKKYLIYAYGKSDELGTGICSRTAFLKDNQDLKILNKLKKKKL